MEDLHSRFEILLKTLDASGISLEFTVGGPEKIYLADHRRPNGAYVENGLMRALSLLDALPGTPEILKIVCPLSECRQDLPGLGLPQPQKRVLMQGQDLLYWEFSQVQDCLRPLFREIIRSEISPEGMEWLAGSVYLAAPQEGFLFHLCDDRSVRISAGLGSTLLPLSQKYGDLLQNNPRLSSAFPTI